MAITIYEIKRPTKTSRYTIITDGLTVEFSYWDNYKEDSIFPSKYNIIDFDDEKSMDKALKKKRKMLDNKGYTVTHGEVPTEDKKPLVYGTLSKAPITWELNLKTTSFGLFVDNERCIVGNENGDIYFVNHEGEVNHQFKLDTGVKAIVGDESWVFAGTNDGKVYDITSKVPREIYNTNSKDDILWMDIHKGSLYISTAKDIMAYDYESELMFKTRMTGSNGWMIRVDDDGIYHGSSRAYSKRNKDNGKNIYEDNGIPSVFFGWLGNKNAYASNSNGEILVYSKTDNQKRTLGPINGTGFSCSADEEEEYVYVGNNRSLIQCYSINGKLSWETITKYNGIMSMQVMNNKMFIVTGDGYLSVLDISEQALINALQGKVSKTKKIKVPKSVPVANSMEMEIATEDDEGVILVCVKKGSKLRMRVESDGYKKDWNVQFPSNLREEGKRFLVGGLKSRGNFYSATGEIKEL